MEIFSDQPVYKYLLTTQRIVAKLYLSYKHFLRTKAAIQSKRDFTLQTLSFVQLDHMHYVWGVDYMLVGIHEPSGLYCYIKIHITRRSKAWPLSLLFQKLLCSADSSWENMSHLLPSTSLLSASLYLNIDGRPLFSPSRAEMRSVASTLDNSDNTRLMYATT